MGRFNLATAPIRDALKAVEGVTLPTVNVIAWIAQNVKTISALDGEGRDGDALGKKFQVVLGEEGDERERLERERLAEAQRRELDWLLLGQKLTLRARTQNALPIWHTHSTVTGSATALGLKGDLRDGLALNGGGRLSKNGREADDAVLADHYANLDGGRPVVKRELGVEEDDGEFEEMEDVGLAGRPASTGGKTVMGMFLGDSL